MVVYSVLIAYGVIVLIAALLYIPKYAQICGTLKRPSRKVATAKRKISLVIPARNESKAIVDLFDSILTQDYDKDYFDINVIVKDENDPTIEMAKKINANYFVVPEQKCKGDALDGYFKSLSPEQMKSYDAFVIIDADAVLTPNYVTELNNALEYDRQIFVTRKYIKNYLHGKKCRSLTCNCAALVYPVLDEVGNMYRARKKIPLNYCGQGLMLRREVIEQLDGWPYRSLTEDYELKMDSLLRDFTSLYYPYAIIYTEEVVKHRDSYERRLRWVTGYSQCDKRYMKDVKAKIKNEKGSAALKFDFLHYKFPVFLFLMITVLTVLTGVGLAVFYALLDSEQLWHNALIYLVGLPSVLLYLVLFVYGLILMLSYLDALTALSGWEKFLTLLVMPFFLLEFVPLYVQSRFRAKKPQKDWRQSNRIDYSKLDGKK
ncbi:MAG: glycosyltransferase family 2 protein [Clostridiales bacterium]|nr:glycosyltransferase family 2 protein [Clostridiales bacterium]